MLWIAECKISPGLVGGVWVVWALHSYLWLLLPIHSAQCQCLTYTLTYMAYLRKTLNDYCELQLGQLRLIPPGLGHQV